MATVKRRPQISRIVRHGFEVEGGEFDEVAMERLIKRGRQRRGATRRVGHWQRSDRLVLWATG